MLTLEPKSATILKDTRNALADPDSKKQFNRQLFDGIAGKYHLATRLLSLGRDTQWKKDLILAIPQENPEVCVDLASGTGDFAKLLHSRFESAKIVGLDLSEEMVRLAKERLQDDCFQFLCGDICAAPFPDHYADVVTGGYALRNVPDIEKALQEIYRILKPDGIALFLEFVQPPPGFRRLCHHGVLHLWGGFVGLLLHAAPSIYRYIPESLSTYPEPEALDQLFQNAGFTKITRHKYFGGMLERIELRKNRG